MIDVAGYKKMKALPAHYAITVADLKGALQKQGSKLKPGDVVLIRTGTLQYWSNMGDREKLVAHDSAGIVLPTAKWLEQNGSMMIGSDTSGLEYWPDAENAETHQKKHGAFMPVHKYLLIEQGVHIAEFHNLEDLSKAGVYEYCYFCATAKIRGATAGFALRPLALH